MKNQISLLLGVFVFGCGFSQTNNFWKKNTQPIQNKTITLVEKKVVTPNNTYDLSVEKLKKVLSYCPKRYESFGKSNVIITLPSEDGKFKKYRIKETNVLHPDLAKKFPNIKSYVGTSVSRENELVHFSLGNNDFRAMIMKSDATIINIKHPTINSKMYMITSKKEKSEPISCQTTDNYFENFLEKKTTGSKELPKRARRDANDSRLRVYRMAIAVTGELSKIYTDKASVTNGSVQQRKAAVLAELNALMTRVNAVYERDLGTTFELVPNILNSIFLDPVTDGITHGNTGISINESQGILDAQIGNANYDIGHVLDSDGTGRGALNSVCVDDKKAQGSTGAHPFTSVNDYFFRTFVHEIGHQFGANHSFNNACGGNRLDEGAVEPGGGNSIMAYQGCAPNYDLQTSHVFFHAKQIDEMWNHIVNTAGCGITKSVGNSAPVASIGGNYTIPRSTPFILEGSATDANTPVNQLTYTWDQMDKEIAPMPPLATSTGGPLFRFKPPTTSPIRYMPDLGTVKAGNSSSEWEVTPSVARTINFRFTVRDNHAGGGNTDSRDAVITVAGNAGPFVITSQNSRFDAPVGSTQTVTWNVAGTTGNGVNAANVDILLSTDGGNTYPITLASAVPNDGSHQITIPDEQGGVNRIMVRGTNNIFFDITNANFSITDGNSDPMPTNYCAAGYQGNNYIDEVIFGDINNKSENSGYSDFTNLGTNVIKGQPVTLTVNPGIDTWDPNYFGAWIDWNKDGDFEDTGEEVLLTTNGQGGVTTTIVVPNTAKNGATRLRVRYKLHTAPEPCGIASSKGDEVEDYFVFIKGNSTPDSEAPSTPTNLTASNIESTSLTLNWTGSIDNIGVSGYDVFRNNEVTPIGSPSGTIFNVTGLTKNTSYSFYVKAKDFSNNTSGNSNTINIVTKDGPSPGTDPCAASTTQNSTLHITNVSFGSINNSSTNAAYNDFSTISTNLSVGQSETITIDVNNSSWTFNDVGVWIDWNNNGQFETSEEVYARYGAGPYSGSVTPPNTAVSNTLLRMRVRLGYGSSERAQPCGTDTSFGEVEDYSVVVSGGVTGDTQPPTAPSGLVASSITSTSLTLIWTDSTDNVGVTGYDVYQGNINLGTVTGTSYNVIGLTGNTSYSFTVRAKDAASNQSTESNIANVTTTGGTNPDPTLPTGYCNAGSQGTNYIGGVTFGSINNTSQNSNYTNFTAQSTNVSIGQTLTLTVTPGITASNWSANVVGAWIDWNRDGDFTDANEEVLMKTPGTGGETTSVTVPNNAQSGATKLRVRYRWASNPNPCGTSANDGDEVEDYVVVIGGSTGDTQAPSTPTNLLASNVNETTLTLNWTASTDNVGITGYDIFRGGTYIGTATGTTYSVTGLTANTAYTFSVRAKDAAGNQSASSNTVNVITQQTNPNPTYCFATGNDGPEGISNVVFAGINNSSVRNVSGYDDFTSISTNVNVGTSHNLTVTILGYQGGSNDEIYAFFDWNRDGDFSDAGEEFNLIKTNGLTGAISVTVPQTAITGSTRMRLLVSYYDTEKNSCDTGTNDVRYGEYEDYTINVTNSSANASPSLFSNGGNKFSLFPNPFNKSFTLNVTSFKSTNFNVSIYDIVGRQIYSQEYNGNQTKIENLGERITAPGNYFIRIQSNDKTEVLRVLKK
ncbi:hypothetical protein DS884_00700 [Tenacibaculum sp. E3R01]|uniref:GEVED domain-containing protein n=1 Tax=Tenacibaculum sp. E3R01 TaxID=2267227 RepID=UPI000DEA1971|nr:GEVED domain-containing protein [Tenacibaculum sp. E3R01]RBW63223.1 hypothetical protein DS884_00700 [Tenacibaculum sp. E3R01]